MIVSKTDYKGDKIELRHSEDLRIEQAHRFIACSDTSCLSRLHFFNDFMVGQPCKCQKGTYLRIEVK